MEKKIWIGSNPSAMTCDGCSVPFRDAFSDIKTRRGPWGNFCDVCLPKYSIARFEHYGTGLGQRYEKQGKHWVKTKG